MGAHWAKDGLAAIRAAFETGNFALADRRAFECALEASEQFRSNGQIEDLYLRALFYGLAATAAARGHANESLVQMFFMSKLTLNRIGSLPGDVDDWYKESYVYLQVRLGNLATSVSALGIDPEQDPIRFFKMVRAMDF